MHAFDLLALANTSWTDRVIPYLVLLIVLVIAGVIAFANYQNSRPFRIESTSSLEPEEVLDTLQRTFTRDGWVFGFRDSGSLVMSIDRRASLGSTAALGCFSVWLGLIYMLSSNRRITVEIDADNHADGSLIVTRGSRSGSYLRYVAWHVHRLPKDSYDTLKS